MHKWFSFTSVKALSFLWGLNNLSFFGFQRNAWTWIATCVKFFSVATVMISWFVLTLELSARIQNTPVVHLQRLEDSGKPNREIYKKILALKELSQSIFCSEDGRGFKVRTALSLFTINDPCHLPSVNFEGALPALAISISTTLPPSKKWSKKELTNIWDERVRRHSGRSNEREDTNGVLLTN